MTAQFPLKKWNPSQKNFQGRTIPKISGNIWKAWLYGCSYKNTRRIGCCMYHGFKHLKILLGKNLSMTIMSKQCLHFAHSLTQYSLAFSRTLCCRQNMHLQSCVPRRKCTHIQPQNDSRCAVTMNAAQYVPLQKSSPLTHAEFTHVQYSVISLAYS